MILGLEHPNLNIFKARGWDVDMMIYWMGIQTIMSSSAILSNSSSPSGHTTAILYNRAKRGNIRIKSMKL